LWRTNKATVRESIGVSTDKQWIYAKTMNDVIVKFSASRSNPDSIYRIDCKYGYDHVPSMLIPANDLMLTGTKNGIIYAVSQNDNTMKWAYKIDNSMVHTVQVSNKKTLFASTMDGKVVRLNW
jgi:outer membrane protein assembly factor BamB